MHSSDLKHYNKNNTSGVILNRNTSQYERRLKQIAKQKQFEQLAEDVVDLKSDINELKRMMMEFIDASN